MYGLRVYFRIFSDVGTAKLVPITTKPPNARTSEFKIWWRIVFLTLCNFSCNVVKFLE